jgi:NADH-quinone oxidoreductase subunit G
MRMATIFVENKPYTVKDGQNLLHACLSLGFNLPYFCWHPAMHSVGACRQCAIKQFKDEKDPRGRIVMACMTQVQDGMRISVEDPEAKAFRRGIIELLMTNHPHDCPICDEGGECHLQDMTVMTGHAYRRFRFRKRTHRNQNLGPFVNHEMNRCIACYRCVRFYRDIAAGRDFDVFNWHHSVYFGRAADGVLASEFSGNLVEVCPTGVFTDKTLKGHYTRKWDLQTAPSVCVHCGLGCNTLPGERYGELRRIRNRYNGEVNGYWLCDRGRYGYEFVNSERRIRQPLRRAESGAQEPITREAGLGHVAALLADPKRIIGIASPRASLESNFALRSLVGSDRFFLGLSETDHRLTTAILNILRNGPARSPSQKDVSRSDAVFLLGQDVTSTAPMLALALRQALLREPSRLAAKLRVPEWDAAAFREVVQRNFGSLFLATADETKFDGAAARVYRAAPDDLARLGFAVAHAISSAAPAVPDLSAEVRSLAEEIAQKLKGAEQPAVIAGASCGSEAMIQAAANVAWALCAAGRPAQLCLTVPECNSLGLAMIGGGGLREAIQAVESGTADTVIILENDLYRRADESAVDALLDAARHVIVLDHLANATTAKAEIVLPAATFAETDGTLVNSEGRAQRFFGVFVPQGEIQGSWRWIRDIAASLPASDPRSPAGGWRTFDEIVAAMAKALPVFELVPTIAPPAGFLIAGQKIPREPHRYSGRTAMTADLSVHEPKPPDDPDSPMSYSMEGYPGEPPSSLLAHDWSPGWNSVQALNKFQAEVGGPLRGGDPGRRLIEPAPVGKPPYFDSVPAGFRRRPDEWLVIPVEHIFGSEELSVLSSGVAELTPKPYLGMSLDDAKSLGIADGDEAELSLTGAAFRLPVRVRPALPRGVAELPAGLPGLLGVGLPARGTVRRRGGDAQEKVPRFAQNDTA